MPLRVGVRARAIPYSLWAALAVALGVVVRIRPFVRSDWPINDGGMFFAAVSEIWRNGYGLPAMLHYNGESIPFAYPPLAFYTAAALGGVASLPLTDVFRILPLLFSCLSVVAFHQLARRLLADDRAVIAATIGFGLVPASWIWMVMGGGLTRALGLTFFLLALANVLAVFERPTRRGVVVAGTLSALTLLTHIEFAWAIAFSATAFWVAHPSRPRFRSLVAIGAVGVALSAPWLLIVVARHGLSPFLAASQTGQLIDPLEQLLAFRQSGEPNFPLFSALALLGALVAFARGARTTLLWLAAIAVLDPRSWGTLSSAPLALLAASGAVDGVAPLLTRHRTAAGILAAVAVAYLAHGSLISHTELLDALTPSERDAMAWVAANAPPDARFAVVSEHGWADDRESEWFPVLAKRVSVSTAQGFEWLSLGAFRQRLLAIQALQQCGAADGNCIEMWASEYAVGYDFVFVPKYRAGIRLDGSDTWCCMGLRNALLGDPRFALVYDGAGATIYERSKR
ncbi:MAG TPA: hypothetical protein VFA01_08185 [Candidatus Dormibacteraeota bacterium]|nr:hypothetical protein [Candidatus Dormibacteraeota bacterium]